MVAAGDTILLCTDGLNRNIDDEQIAALLSADGSARDKCNNLVAAANNAGGTDNITVIVSDLFDELKAPLSGGSASTDAAIREAI
jgi:serine/threonine protein phosphatase PrpC